MFEERDVRFYCIATLTRLSPEQRWWFSSCTTCHKTSNQDGAAYKCTDPKCIGTDALPRYKLCFVAANDDAQTEVGRELLGLPLISLLRHGHPSGAQLSYVVETARRNDAIPKELASVISCKYRFVVSISNKCYQGEDGDLCFQVHRIDAPADKQSHSSVFYRGSSSTSGSGPSSSSSDIVLSANLPSMEPWKVASPDLTAHETLSTEDLPPIPPQNTPPQNTRVSISIRRFLLQPRFDAIWFLLRVLLLTLLMEMRCSMPMKMYQQLV